ncbi:MAG: phosphatase PAP2 family protein [Parasporobacterium sp.]|nr:phosphatase PAP2 family protein [Parasporobacterium sp.]
MSFFLATAAAGSVIDTTFLNFDLGVFEFFGNLHNEVLTVIAKALTALGETKYVVMVALIGLILILFKRTRKYGLALVFAIIIGTLLTNIIIKPMVLRIRPYNTLQDISSYFGWYQSAGMLAESDYSFPSGHTTGAMEIAVVLCMSFASAGKKKIAWIFPVLAVLTACSRVYLMVHYATDVIPALFIGALAGILGYLISSLITRKCSGAFFWHRLDLERLFVKKSHKQISAKAATIACLAAWVIIFAISFTSVLHAGGDTLRCAYDGEYTCYNEAQTGSKYPAIDGKYYCKIHWKELNGQNQTD